MEPPLNIRLRDGKQDLLTVRIGFVRIGGSLKPAGGMGGRNIKKLPQFHTIPRREHTITPLEDATRIKTVR